MLKAIIVDDELFIRKGLHIMIDWEKEGISIVGEAANGKQAISLMKVQKPDIVITDIKMPVMGGLDFIEYMRNELKSNVQIIVLSGYADFKFAQKAMQFGVKKYVLKPIDEKELLEVLNEVKKDIIAGENVEYESQISLQNRKSALVKRILWGKNINIVHNGTEVNFSVKNESKYFCVIFHMKKEWYSSHKAVLIEGKGQKSEIEILTNIINEKNFSDFIDLFEYDNLVGFFVDFKQMTCKGLTACELLNSVNDAIKGSYSNYSNLFMGQIVENFPDNIKKAFDTAYETMKLCFYHKNIDIYQYSDFEEKSMNKLFNTEIFPVDLLDIIVAADITEIKNKIELIFNYLKKIKLDPEVVKIKLNYLVHKIVNVIADIDGSYNRDFEKYLVYNINYREIDIDNLKEMVQAFCTNSSLYIQDIKENSGNGISYKIKKYVDIHYAEDVTLTKLAQHFFVNTVYAGQAFKKAYEMKFNDYLNYVRIDEAKKLLQLTGLKAYEISLKVGYTKPEYFSKKFEEISGLSPSEYREKERSKQV